MKRSFLLLLCATIACSAFSQSGLPHLAVTGKRYDTTIRRGHSLIISGTHPNDSLLSLLSERMKRKPSHGNMPNALAVPGPPDIYVGNNGKGHDIYRGQIDNMPIVKPDSTFASNMPYGPPLWYNSKAAPRKKKNR